MNPYDFALLAKRAYSDAPTVGKADSASRMHVYGDVHVFRGSDDSASWRADLDCSAVEVFGWGKIHAGFFGAYAAIMPACMGLPAPSASAGHSLGAPLCVFHSLAWAERGVIVPIYAFEPPKFCLDGVMADLIKSKGIPFYACRNGHDLVTQVPPNMTLPGPLIQIGKPALPVDNIVDHDINRVISALQA